MPHIIAANVTRLAHPHRNIFPVLHLVMVALTVLRVKPRQAPLRQAVSHHARHARPDNIGRALHALLARRDINVRADAIPVLLSKVGIYARHIRGLRPARRRAQCARRDISKD